MASDYCQYGASLSQQNEDRSQGVGQGLTIRRIFANPPSLRDSELGEDYNLYFNWLEFVVGTSGVKKFDIITQVPENPLVDGPSLFDVESNAPI